MDEPTSALDVVAQRSLMSQIKELQERLGFAVIFVTHDMSLVRHYSDRLMVMYAGQVAEIGATAAVFERPRHPYSQGLLDAFPSIRGPRRALTGIPGSPPDLARPPAGCRFHPRCPEVRPECSTREPGCIMSTGPPCDASCTRILRGRRCESMADPVRRLRWAAPPDRRAHPALPSRRVLLEAGPPRGRRPRHDDRRARDRCVGRRERQREEHVARLLAMLYRPTAGEIDIRDRGAQLRSRKEPRLPGRGADGVPGPVQRHEPGLPGVARGDPKPASCTGPSWTARNGEAEAERVFNLVGLTPGGRDAPQVSLRDERGTAPACRVRPGIGRAPEADTGRRTGIDARCLDPGRHPQHDGRPARARRASRSCTSPTTWRAPATSRIVSSSCMRGHIVETGPTERALADPQHPYTQLLLSAVPDPTNATPTVTADSGEPPRVVNPTEGCSFRSRCPIAIDECGRVTPRLRRMGTAHEAACHRAIPDGMQADAELSPAAQTVSDNAP